jgi:hypothetical protein
MLCAHQHMVGSVEVSDGAPDLPVQLFPKGDPAKRRKSLTRPARRPMPSWSTPAVLIDSGAGRLFGPTLGRFDEAIAAKASADNKPFRDQARIAL